MTIHQKYFHELTVSELYEILRARTAVFVVEQQCPYQEEDGDIDFRSKHLWLEKEGRIVGYARVYWHDEEKGIAQIGRILTIERGTGLGLDLMHKAISICRQMGADEIILEAQVYAQEFYEKLGFQVCSEQFDEDGIPHQLMNLRL